MLGRVPHLRLSKFDATGNDFLVLLDLEGEHVPTPADVRALCDRHGGIGADGVIRVLAGRDGADVAMELRNADGGRAEMSGNGMRCLAALVRREGVVTADEFTVATEAGVKTVVWRAGDDTPYARVHMGDVTFDPSAIPIAVDSPFGLKAEVDGTVYEGDAAGVGNPHFVLFVDDPRSVPIAHHGARLEHDTRFPHRVSVEFVALEGPDVIRMRVWERGVGETRSCGTGACAAAAAARRRGLVGDAVRVQVPGGLLSVELGPKSDPGAPTDGPVWLGGPVTFVADHAVELSGQES